MIEFLDVDAGYRDVVRIFAISCKLLNGAIISVIGPNGSGKSTLLKTILGMTTRFRGEVLLDGKGLADYKKEELARKIAFLPQNRNVPWITVERMILHGRFPYLSYPRRYTAKDYEMVEKELEHYGLLNLRNQQLQELSGGERQKVYLAMARVQDSEYYLLDEPTTYLDSFHQFELLEEIKQLKQQGKTCIVVLHDLEAALKISDQIIVLEEGKLAFCGEREGLLNQGLLERIFHIRVKCFEDGNETWYHFKPFHLA